MLSVEKDSFDDLLRGVLTGLLEDGVHVTPTKGACRELVGVSLCLSSPRARLSRSDRRGKFFSALGELVWYLRGSNSTNEIAYYIPRYRDYDEDGVIFGGYGPRLVAEGNRGEIKRVVDQLTESPNTRKAVVQIFSNDDLDGNHKDVPCTISFQFLLRDSKLNMVVSMRSNDAYMGLPHDIFCFTMIQEIVASRLEVELGTYTHFVGSLHLYDRDEEAARSYLEEGFQSGAISMPEMPASKLEESLEQLLAEELQARTGDGSETSHIAVSYWRDLANLLFSFRAFKDRDPVRQETLARMVEDNSYAVILQDQAGRIRDGGE